MVGRYIEEGGLPCVKYQPSVHLTVVNRPCSSAVMLVQKVVIIYAKD
jgi:hypothetical protein